MIEPSQARYREAVALARLAELLGVTLLPEWETCVCLEKLADRAESDIEAMGWLDGRKRGYASLQDPSASKL